MLWRTFGTTKVEFLDQELQFHVSTVASNELFTGSDNGIFKMAANKLKIDRTRKRNRSR